MKNKTVTMTGIKTAGLADGEFIGWASTFGNTDSQGDRVMPGAFAKSIDAMASGQVTPILWEHQRRDPKAFVGEIKSARETDEGLEIHAKLDLDSPEGQAAYRQVKARRVGALSIGYGVRDAVKAADGVQELTDLDLVEVSLVVRPANDRALITASKSGDTSAIVLARKALANMAGKAADDPEEDPADDAEPTEDDDADTDLGTRLLESLQAATDAAQALVDAAESEGRDLTAEETAEVVKCLDIAKGWKAEVQAWADKTPTERWGAQYVADVMGGKTSAEEFRAKYGDQETATKFQQFDATGVGVKTKSTTKEIPVDHTDKFLTLGAGRKAAAATIAAKMTGRSGALHDQDGALTGTKALTTGGQVTTDIPVAPTVIPTGRPATSILDVIPTQRRSTPSYRYIRQNSRALAAAAVAEGAEKPVSAMGTQTIDGHVSVIAHLSEPLDKFVLSDAPQLTRFVQEELVYGLDVAIQAQVLTGNGTAPNQTGVLATSGIQVQAFDTSALVSIRKAMTKAEAAGYAPSVAVLRPEDWETIELTATSDEAVAFRGVPIDLLERKIWGLRVVLSTALPAKAGLVLDPSAVSIDTLGGLDIEWSTESGELFSHNQVQARVETRIGVSVYQPAAIYRVATQAA